MRRTSRDWTAWPPNNKASWRGQPPPSTPIRGRGELRAPSYTWRSSRKWTLDRSNQTQLPWNHHQHYSTPKLSCPLQGVWHGSVLMVCSTSNAISVQYKLVPISFGTITAKHPQTTWYTQDVQVTSVPSPKKSPHWPPCCYHALITPWSSLVALTAQSSWINPLLSLNHCG